LIGADRQALLDLFFSALIEIVLSAAAQPVAFS
jgi:hypothetical protein